MLFISYKIISFFLATPIQADHWLQYKFLEPLNPTSYRGCNDRTSRLQDVHYDVAVIYPVSIITQAAHYVAIIIQYADYVGITIMYYAR